MKNLKRAFALVITASLIFSAPTASYAAEVKGRGAVSSSSSGSTAIDGGESVNGTLTQDTAAEPAQETQYTKAEAEAVVRDVFGYLDDAARREIKVQYVLNSVWYDPANCMLKDDGKSVLVLYRGKASDYETVYSLGMEGLTFFSNPTALFSTNGDSLIFSVVTESRFTQADAEANYAKLLQIRDTVQSVKAATDGMDDMAKSKFICDYIADKLSYDDSLKLNCLADAVSTNVSACVGYNALTAVLFGNAGLNYRSIEATSKDDGTGHILGIAKIMNSWLIFDTTNYDQNYGKEPYWIYSDTMREGKFYNNLLLLEHIPGIS